MGNRAVLTTGTPSGYSGEAQGVYLHWNGGRDSVTAFLKYCELQGFRSPEKNDYNGWSDFVQIVQNFFGRGSSVRVGKVKELDCDNGNNGLYIISDWQIVGRRFMENPEQDEYDLKDALLSIDDAQPKAMQIRDKILFMREFCDAKKFCMTLTGDASNGYAVTEIRHFETRRSFVTLFKSSDYGTCLDWMNDHAAKNGFIWNPETDLFEKTA